MPEKENPIERVWTWQFVFPLYVFASGLLIYIVVGIITKKFDLWLLIGIAALGVVFYQGS